MRQQTKKGNGMSNKKHKKPRWSFTVNAIEEMDVNRVLRETPLDTPWVVIADRFGEPVLLCVRVEHLRRFTVDDRIEVCGTNLQEAWGGRYLPYFGHKNGCLNVHHSYTCTDRLVLDGWKVSENHSNFHPLSSEEIRRMVAADKYVRRIPVRVYLAGDFD
jgi:hypothetical protein